MARYRCIQRLGVSGQTTLEGTLESIKKYPGAWDTVAWFAPADFNDPDEVQEQKVKEFEAQVKAAKNAGCKVQFNMGYVIGHGTFQGGKSAVVPHMVGPEGEDGIVSVCPRSQQLKDRVSALFARFARLKPECIWIDDDFRIYEHVPVQCACFCDTCIGDFNKKHGYSFTRPELNSALLQDHFPQENALRRQWLEFMHEGMTELARSIAEAVHAVDDDVIMGLMIASAEHNTFDLPEYRDYVRALANSKGRVYLRPGCMFYNDWQPFDGVHKAFTVAVTNALSELPGVETYAEMVTCPYVKRGKSDQINAWEAALHIGLGGCDGVMYEAINSMLPEMSSYLARMDKERPFLAELSESLAGHKQIGFWPYFSTYQWTAAGTKEHMKQMHDFPFTLPRQLLKLGVPLTAWKENALGVVLAGELVKAMPTEELETWLGKAIYADADAVAYAQQKLGYDAFGVEVLQQAGSSVEIFADDPLNAPYAGFKRASFWGGYGQGGGNVRVTKARSLSAVPEDEALAGTAVYETPQGGRVCIQTRAPWADDIMGFAKSTQILNILDWMCDTVPVRIDTDCRVGQVLWQGENDLVCFLFSMDHDCAENVTLRLKTPAKAEQLMPDGSWQSIGQGAGVTVETISPFAATAVRLTPLE